jgi:hypothetical protein
MTPLEKEITELSERWAKYVGADHHKDRDCHWYVEKYYSYGNPPYYQAFHWAYIGADFEGSKCKTLEEAEEELRDNLIVQIHNEIQNTTRSLQAAKEHDPNDKWYSSVQEMIPELEYMLEALNGELNA